MLIKQLLLSILAAIFIYFLSGAVRKQELQVPKQFTPTYEYLIARLAVLPTVL